MAIGPIQTFFIERETEADSYLSALLAEPENRSMDVVRAHAQRLIKDDDLKTYFLIRAKQTLKI